MVTREGEKGGWSRWPRESTLQRRGKGNQETRIERVCICPHDAADALSHQNPPILLFQTARLHSQRGYLFNGSQLKVGPECDLCGDLDCVGHKKESAISEQNVQDLHCCIHSSTGERHHARTTENS